MFCQRKIHTMNKKYNNNNNNEKSYGQNEQTQKKMVALELMDMTSSLL